MLVTIKNENLSLTVSKVGAEIKSIKYQGEERMHDSNPAFWSRSAPLLFPNIGTITNGETIINGKSYKMVKHGFLRDQEFDVVKKDEKTLEFLFKATKETKAIYPFDFLVKVIYELEGAKVLSRVEITNMSNDSMPYNFGLHPAFKTPLTADEKFEDYKFIIHSLKEHPQIKVELSNGTIDFRTVVKNINFNTPLYLNYEDYKNDAIVFDNIDFDEVTLTNKDETKGVIFHFKSFPMLGIWTPFGKGANFICIEPWIGCADPTVHDGKFLSKKHIRTLLPNETDVIEYSFKFF